MQSGLDKCGRVGPIVPVHGEVEGGEEGEGFLLSAENFVGDDAAPKGIERGSRENCVSSFRPEVEVVERKLNVEVSTSKMDGTNDAYFRRIPHQINNAISECLCCNSVSARGRAIGRTI